MSKPEIDSYVDFSSPEYNTYLVDTNKKVHPTNCRNCNEIFELSTMGTVKPGYRFCKPCYDTMEEIGQIVADYVAKDGKMILMWEGDPFNRRTDDPTDGMFREEPNFQKENL